MAPKECRVYKVLKTIICQRLREKMMFGFNTVIVQERATAGVCGGICKIRVLLLSLYRLNKISSGFLKLMW
jgi:hypothetical protein